MKEFALNHKKEIAFLLVMFCLFFMISLVIPFNNAPDESARYMIAQYIVKYHSLPLGTDPEVRLPVWGVSYAFAPYLSYMISSIFMFIVSLFTDNSDILLISARFSNVLCSTITVGFVIAIAEELFSNKSKWLFISLFSCFPCFIFVSSYVNCDALALTSGAIIVYAWIIGMKTNWNKCSCILLMIGMSICVLSYQNAYGYILLTIVLFLYEVYRNFKENQLGVILKKGAIIFIGVTILGGWFYIRNYFEYGDLLGTKVSEEQAEIYADHDFKPSNKKSIKEQGISLGEMLFEKGWLETTYRSYIGVFGNMNINMPANYYQLYSILFLVGLISVILSLNKWKLFSNERKVFYYLLFIAIIIPVCLTVYYSYFRDYQPQGRYALSSLLPLTLLMSKGFVGKIEKYAPRFSPYIISILSFILVLTAFSIVLNSFFATYLV